MNKWRVLSCCLIYFGNGMNDSAPGALIPYIEEDYHIGFATVALIFVSQAVGFILAAFFMDALQTKPGRAKSLMFAEALMLTGYTMIVCTPPFVVVVVAYLFLRYAMATNLSLNNLFCANLAQSTIVLGVGHGSYGVGGILGPIVATSMVSKGLIWSRYYFVPLGIRFICIAFGGWAFWAYEKETPTRLYEASERTAGHQVTLGSGEPTKFQLFKRALKTKVTLMGTLFIFSYQGAEVSISGWVISYLIKYKRGNPAGVGYVTAGFWGGITAGRFLLLHLGAPGRRTLLRLHSRSRYHHFPATLRLASGVHRLICVDAWVLVFTPECCEKVDGKTSRFS